MRSSSSSLRSPGAFTVVELLVTVGIIVLLASLVLPVARNWNTGANRTACAGNLRQLFLYLDAYARDNRGVYPAVSDKDTGYTWWLTLQNYINSPSQEIAVGKRTVFLCPAALQTYPRKVARRTYGMNCDGLKTEQGILDWRVPVRPVTRSKMAQTLFIADTCNSPANNGDGYHYFRADADPKAVDVLEARHGGKANALFLDGHIEAVDPKSPETLLAIRNLGQ